MVFELQLCSQNFVMLHWHQFGVKNSFCSTRSATGKASFTLGRPYTIFPWLSSFFHHQANISLAIIFLYFCFLTHAATRVRTPSVIIQKMNFNILSFEFVILHRPESIPESVTQKFIDSTALIYIF